MSLKLCIACSEYEQSSKIVGLLGVIKCDVSFMSGRLILGTTCIEVYWFTARLDSIDDAADEGCIRFNGLDKQVTAWVGRDESVGTAYNYWLSRVVEPRLLGRSEIQAGLVGVS